MRKFLLDFAIVLFLLLVLNVIIYQFIIYPLVYEKYEEPSEHLTNSSAYKDYILADSHGWELTKHKDYIIERFKSDSIFNFSYASDSYGDILVKLHWLINNNIEIDQIVLSLDDHMISKRSNNRNRTIIYSNAKLHKEIYNVSPFKYYYYYVKKYLPLFNASNQKLIVEYLKAKLIVNDIAYQEPWSSQNNAVKKKAVNRRLRTFFPKNKFEVNELLNENLQQIVELCDKNNISILGLKFPLDSVMIHEMERKFYLDSVETIFNKMNVNSKILNFQRSLSNANMFYDADHINIVGADSLSVNIIKALKN